MVNITKITKKKLGEILIAEGVLSNEQLDQALKEQQTSGLLLGEVLVKLGYVTELDIVRALSAQFGLPYIDATRYIVTKEVFNLIPYKFMEQHQFVPLDKIGNILTVAVSGPLSENVFSALERTTGCEIYLFVSTTSQVREVIQTHKEALMDKKYEPKI